MKSKDFDKSYDELMIYLQDQNTINEMTMFLKKYKLTINVKKFTIFFMIYFQKEQMLDHSDTSVELFKQIKRTIKIFDSLQEEYKKYKVYLLQYVVQETEKWFDIWKLKDKMEIIMPMIHMYHYLDEQKKDNNDIWNEEIIKQQNLIKSKILKLDKSDYVKELINIRPRIIINENVKSNIINVIHKAYWDNFQTNVNEKNYGQLIGFVQEIKDMLKKLIPNRLDLQEEIEMSLDIEILKQRLENNVMNQNDIFEMINYIINWIRQLQAPIDDRDTEEWYEYLKTLTSWDVLMKDFFMITFAKLDKIRNNLFISNNVD